jgi:hypothetical protein
VDEGLSKGVLPPRFDRPLSQMVDNGVAENAPEPSHGALRALERGLAFYGSEHALLKEVMRNVGIPDSASCKR